MSQQNEKTPKKNRMTYRVAALIQTAVAVKHTAVAVERMIEHSHNMIPQDDDKDKGGSSKEGDAALHHAYTVLGLSAIALNSMMDVVVQQLRKLHGRQTAFEKMQGRR